MHYICYYNYTLEFQHTARFHSHKADAPAFTHPSLSQKKTQPWISQDSAQPGLAAEEGSALPWGGWKLCSPMGLFWEGQGRQAVRYFLWLQCLMRLTLFLRFNSSIDMKKGALGSAAGGCSDGMGSTGAAQIPCALQPQGLAARSIPQ